MRCARRCTARYLVLVVDRHRSRPDGARLVEAGENLGHAAVRDEQLAGDVARAHAEQGQLDDAPSHVVGQRAPVDEDAAQLVHSRLACVSRERGD